MTATRATAALPERFNFAQHLITLNAGRSEKIAYIDNQGTFYACMLAYSRAQVVIVSAALLPTLRAAIAKAQHEVKQIIVSRGNEAAPNTTDFEAWLSCSTLAANPANTAADESAFWLYSSGSTGRPKGSVHTQGNLYWTAELYAQPILGLTQNDVCFSAAKLFFAYGLGNALSFPLSVGATTILMAERSTPDACFKRFTELKPTVFFGAPTGYAGMLASFNLPAREQVALRMCSSAGEALPREIGEKFTSHFSAEIIDGLGSTEMLHIFLSNRPGDVRYGTTGKAFPGPHKYPLQLDFVTELPKTATGKITRFRLREYETSRTHH